MSEKRDQPIVKDLSGSIAEMDALLGQADQVLEGFSDENAKAAFAELLEQLNKARNSLKAAGDELNKQA